VIRVETPRPRFALGPNQRNFRVGRQSISHACFETGIRRFQIYLLIDSYFKPKSLRAMFQLSEEEFSLLKSQIVISSWGGPRRARPYAFTEQGVAMLSSVLKSKRAIHVNIEIMRTFVRLRKLLLSHAELARKLAALERKYDSQFKIVFDAIRQLMTPPESKRRPIGFLGED
jgi:hypothetical protein